MSSSWGTTSLSALAARLAADPATYGEVAPSLGQRVNPEFCRCYPVTGAVNDASRPMIRDLCSLHGTTPSPGGGEGIPPVRSAAGLNPDPRVLAPSRLGAVPPVRGLGDRGQAAAVQPTT